MFEMDTLVSELVGNGPLAIILYLVLQMLKTSHNSMSKLVKDTATAMTKMTSAVESLERKIDHEIATDKTR